MNTTHRPKTVKHHIWKLIRLGFTDRQIKDILEHEWAAWALSKIDRRIIEERQRLLED